MIYVVDANWNLGIYKDVWRVAEFALKTSLKRRFESITSPRSSNIFLTSIADEDVGLIWHTVRQSCDSAVGRACAHYIIAKIMSQTPMYGSELARTFFTFAALPHQACRGQLQRTKANVRQTYFSAHWAMCAMCGITVCDLRRRRGGILFFLCPT